MATLTSTNAPYATTVDTTTGLALTPAQNARTKATAIEIRQVPSGQGLQSGQGLSS